MQTDGYVTAAKLKDAYLGIGVDVYKRQRVDRTNYDLRTKLVRKRGKAIYSKEDKPSLKSLTPTSTLSDLDVYKRQG